MNKEVGNVLASSDRANPKNKKKKKNYGGRGKRKEGLREKTDLQSGPLARWEVGMGERGGGDKDDPDFTCRGMKKKPKKTGNIWELSLARLTQKNLLGHNRL